MDLEVLLYACGGESHLTPQVACVRYREMQEQDARDAVMCFGPTQSPNF